MLDFAAARARMVESQLRPNAITDVGVLEAMASVAREDFVPAERRNLAYMDGDVAVAKDRYLMEPMVFGRLLQLAEIAPSDRVLDIGCATGYGAAVLARLAETVIAIEEDRLLADEAARLLRQQGAGNVTVEVRPHAEGDAAHGPYDAIVIEGRVPAVPEPLLEQLREGGRLVAVVGTGNLARAMLYRRNGSIGSYAAFDASVQQLPGIVAPKPGFVF
ncbi:MAG: protein-L-isoaspartate O-methyltransferase [Rhizobiales bacterium]|nr:protein-L-isoaspartate O-methyltransferase [Hyphomicrobiales bacterium]